MPQLSSQASQEPAMGADDDGQANDRAEYSKAGQAFFEDSVTK